MSHGAEDAVALPLPPGSFGWPVIGESLDFVRSPRQFIATRRARYGDVFKTSVFGTRTVFLLGPDANRWIFTNDGTVLENRWNYAARRLLGDTVVSKLTGKAHKDRRRLLAPHFTRAASARFSPRVRELARQHLRDWSERGGALNVYDSMRELAFDCAVALLFGGSAAIDRELLSCNFERLGLGMFAPLPLQLPFTSFGKAMRARKRLFDYLIELVAQRRKLERQPDDLLGSLIEARNEDGTPLSLESIVDEAQLQLWAGHDTTVNAMSNLMLNLALHPEIFARARAELDAATPLDEIQADELEKLPYLNQIINEGMRLVPPVAGSYRAVLRDSVYRGHRIPRGWTVALSIVGTSRDTWWREPDRFDPDRWGPERAEHKRDPFAAIPFGGGPRTCIGQHFAMAEMRMIMAMLIRHHDWRLLPDQDLRIQALPFPRPRSGILVWFGRRQEVPARSAEVARAS
jgi:cytochrome P450